MKEYLQDRIKQMETEYSDLLKKIGQEDKTTKKTEWEFVNDRKSRIDECRLLMSVITEKGYFI